MTKLALWSIVGLLLTMAVFISANESEQHVEGDDDYEVVAWGTGKSWVRHGHEGDCDECPPIGLILELEEGCKDGDECGDDCDDGCCGDDGDCCGGSSTTTTSGCPTTTGGSCSGGSGTTTTGGSGSGGSGTTGGNPTTTGGSGSGGSGTSTGSPSTGGSGGGSTGTGAGGSSGSGGNNVGAIVGGTLGGVAGVAGVGAAGVGAGYALWKFLQRQGASPMPASALDGTEMGTMNQNALFHPPTDGMHTNDLFQAGAVGAADAV